MLGKLISWFLFLILSLSHAREINYSKNWKIENELELGEDARLMKYVSERTGLTILSVQTESPIVQGFFCLSTEAQTDDGLPHTLEHLIFLGSEDYPYKEILDLIATRSFSSRTNAFTAKDQTCYTVDTAGSGGFLNILPIYLDHILYPLLRDQDFLTEVHHINGKGEDAGVVYSEMQAIENSMSSILYYTLIDNLYPGKTGYGRNTGGKLENLRKSTNIEKIRSYHSKFYRSENLYLTVIGTINPEDLFKVLDPVENKIMAKRNSTEKEKFQRPFQTPIQDFTTNKTVSQSYPSDDESSGIVVIGMRIKESLTQGIYTVYAWNILSQYLTATSASPLTKAFVDADESMATDVDISVIKYKEPILAAEFSDVAIDNMKKIEPKFRKELYTIVEDGPDKFDLERLHTIVKRSSLRYKMNLENGPHLIVPKAASLDMMYGQNKDDLQKFMEEGSETWADIFLKKEASFWLDMIKDMLELPRLLLLGNPSKKMNEELAEQEKNRIKEQILNLGPEGLKLKAENIDNAVKSQKLPTNEVLTTIPAADVNSIKFRTLTPYNVSNPVSGFNMSGIPFRFHLDDVDSEFIQFRLIISAAELTDEERLYLPFLVKLWTNSQLNVDGGIVEVDQVIAMRSELTLSFYNTLGSGGSIFRPGAYSENIFFLGSVMMPKFEKAIDFMKNVLFNVEFTEDRTRSLLTQILNSIPPLKLSASTITSALGDNIFFNNHSMTYHASFLRQQRFLKEVLKSLNEDSKPVLEKFQSIKDSVLKPENVFVYMATDVEKLLENVPNADQVWAGIFDSQPDDYIYQKFETLSENDFKDPEPQIRHPIFGLLSIESCYMIQSVDYDNSDWETDEVAVLRVLLKYLTARMYERIRGKGLAYSVRMSLSVTEGRLYLKFSRSSQLPSAYEEFRDIIRQYADSAEDTWREDLLDSAKGAVIYSSSKNEETVSSLSGTSLAAYLRDANDSFYNRRFIERLNNVSIQDLEVATEKHLLKFLDPEQTRSAVVCGVSEVDTMINKMKQYGFEMEHIQDIENSFLAE